MMYTKEEEAHITHETMDRGKASLRKFVQGGI